MSWDEMILKYEQMKSVAIAINEVCLSEGILVSYSVCQLTQSVENSVK